MTPEEAQEIAFAGAELLDNISPLIFLCALNGAYILAFSIGVYILLQKKSNGRAQKAFVAFLLVGFVMVVLYSSQNIISSLLMVNFGLVVSLPGGVEAQELAANLKSLAADIIQMWAGPLILGQSGGGNRLVKWGLLLILLLDIGDHFYHISLKCLNIADVIIDTGLFFNSIVNTVTLDWLSVVLNLTVNVVATLLIAYRAWTHHWLIQIISYNKKTQVEVILLLFVESGSVLGVIQISNAIIQALDTHAAEFSPIMLPSIQSLLSSWSK
ncbi:hypothetical protein BT96DRAFT_1106050 [Gymnopus androsaceus JB14]|uniref:Uncharacterized protein n=1 Tax=Gymnopus androsaceus JB14 TaxID=1447944 RepID=A0A6A4GDS7_9AGAR|nr:hypothetical protein BT96DRAFT_1106050 [Gymnopus androsaceus JB14]